MLKTILRVAVVLFSITTFSQTVYSFDEAQKLALGSNKLIVLDFTASWCGPCKKMESEVWHEKEVTDVMSSFIFAKIDFDANKSLTNVYNVNAIPNILIVDGNGKVLEQNVGYMNVSTTLNFLRPFQLNTEFLANEALAFYKNKNYASAMRLGLRNFDYSIYVPKDVTRKFISLGNDYLKTAEKLLDKSEARYDEKKEMLAIIELADEAYSFNINKLEKKVSKIDFDSLKSDFSKKQYQFYQYLIALNNNTAENFLSTIDQEAFALQKAKAEKIFEKHNSDS